MLLWVWQIGMLDFLKKGLIGSNQEGTVDVIYTPIFLFSGKRIVNIASLELVLYCCEMLI